MKRSTRQTARRPRDAKTPIYGITERLCDPPMAPFGVIGKNINARRGAEPYNTRPGAAQTYSQQGTCTASSAPPIRGTAVFLGDAPNTPEKAVAP